MQFNSVCVVGLGYIGLPTAAMFASKGLNVIGVDVCQKTIDIINQGEVHIVETGLQEIVESSVRNGNLRAVNQPEEADVYIIAVPTPFLNKHTEIPAPDLSYVRAACQAIAPVLRAGTLVVLESTSPVGTTEKVCEWLAAMRPDLSLPVKNNKNIDVSVSYCPERVLPGNIITELVSNDRLIGGITAECSQRGKKLYEVFVTGKCYITNARTAEMTKLTENAFRDLQIAFANELSMICEHQNIDVWELIELANKHPRVNILQPGPGVGGHCIAVDPWFIVHANPKLAKLIHLSRQVNDAKPKWIIQKISDTIENLLKTDPDKLESDISVAFYGMTFKPDIDDIRESPALEIIETVQNKHSCKVIILEPNNVSYNQFKNDIIRKSNMAVSADIHVMLVDHKQFRDMPKPNNGILIDTRGIW